MCIQLKKEKKRERKKRLERCEALTNDKSNDDDSRGEGGGDGDGDGNLENHGRWAMGRVVYVCWRRVERERESGWVGSWLVRRWMHRGGGIGSEARGKATGRIQPHQSILRVQGHRPTNYPRLIDTRDKRKKDCTYLFYIYILFVARRATRRFSRRMFPSIARKTRYDVARNVSYSIDSYPEADKFIRNLERD